MAKPYADHFAYHANAIAFGARFSTPGAWEAIGSVALPSIGGRVTASDCGYLLDGGFVNIRAAGSEVVGEEFDGRRSALHRTRSTTWIEGLRIGSYLEIDYLRVELESRYNLVPGEAATEPDFLGLTIKPGRIRVCGRNWNLRTTPELDWINSHSSFVKARADFMQQRSLKGAALARSPVSRVYSAGPQPGGAASARGANADPLPNELRLFGVAPPTKPRTSNIRCPGPVCSHRGPGYKSIAGGFSLGWSHAAISFRFGEFFVSHGRRRFTAVRMSMTRSPRSELIIGELAINGSRYP